MSEREELEALEGLVGSDGWQKLIAVFGARQRSILNDLISGERERDEYHALTAEHRAITAVFTWPQRRAEALRRELERED